MQVRVAPIQKHALPLLILLLVGLIGYVLPWAVASSAPMTLNAFDLAEWTSLHPAQRHTLSPHIPPLLAPLLLRAQLLVLTLIFALATSVRPWRTISAVAILILAVAQLPPFEYLYDIADLNYRQQFVLALASLFGGLLASRIRNQRIVWVLLLLLPVFGIVSVYSGVSQAFDLYRQLQSGASIGLGPWILIACYVGIAASCLRPLWPRADNATS